MVVRSISELKQYGCTRCKGMDFADEEDGRTRCLGCKAVFWETPTSFHWQIRIPIAEIEYRDTGRI